ncbi:unconventional myosin-XVIIIa [Senna tora]|uniref:Unconventional myosin-XVIIIa n=1 Tax=Senna tora TaxID=362788 RepID=A0A834WGM0_9FABA|nr:unconventional myosin-XVIIIa [Senna tora]
MPAYKYGHRRKMWSFSTLSPSMAMDVGALSPTSRFAEMWEELLVEKSKVSSPMLGKSKVDASEKQILLKEVKLSKARRKLAEEEAEKWRAISDGKSKRHSLRSILVNFSSSRLSNISKEPEHFSPISNHILPKSYEQFW